MFNNLGRVHQWPIPVILQSCRTDTWTKGQTSPHIAIICQMSGNFVRLLLIKYASTNIDIASKSAKQLRAMQIANSRHNLANRLGSKANPISEPRAMQTMVQKTQRTLQSASSLLINECQRMLRQNQMLVAFSFAINLGLTLNTHACICSIFSLFSHINCFLKIFCYSSLASQAN